MYKKKKINNKFIVIGSIFIVIILLSFSLTLNRNYTLLEGGLKDLSVFINKVFMFPFTGLNKDKDKDLSDSYIIQKNVNKSLEKEIQELKQELGLKNTLTEYDHINATVLSRNKSYWFNTLTIDKGKKDGIKKGMAVVNSNGLIGKIQKVSNHSSEIKLITSDDVNFKISVSIQTDQGDSYAILSGYDKKSGDVIILGVDKTSKINKDYKIVTSGLSDIFPRGIYIGVVDKVVSDKYDLSKTIYVKTKQNFNNIHYVTVLSEKTNA